MSIPAIILAGGRGSRMGGPLPKPLMPLHGKSLIEYSISRASEQYCSPIIVIVPPKDILISTYLANHHQEVLVFQQPVQDGTAHALLRGLNELHEQSDVLLLYADDGPQCTKKSIADIFSEHKLHDNAITLLCTNTNSNHKVGSLEVEPNGQISGVKTYSETESEDRIIFCGVAMLNGTLVRSYLEIAPMNQRTNEYDFPRIFSMLHGDGYNIRYVLRSEKSKWISINTVTQLEEAEKNL